jgi:hypothetical protein
LVFGNNSSKLALLKKTIEKDFIISLTRWVFKHKEIKIEGRALGSRAADCLQKFEGYPVLDLASRITFQQKQQEIN